MRRFFWCVKVFVSFICKLCLMGLYVAIVLVPLLMRAYSFINKLWIKKNCKSLKWKVKRASVFTRNELTAVPLVLLLILEILGNTKKPGTLRAMVYWDNIVLQGLLDMTENSSDRQMWLQTFPNSLCSNHHWSMIITICILTTNEVVVVVVVTTVRHLELVLVIMQHCL